MARRPFVLLVLAVAVVSPGGASASRGVALDIGRIDVAQKLVQGGGYTLPPIGVRNPGTEETTYRLAVSSVQGQKPQPVPAAWVRFTPDEVTLRPGEIQKVQAKLQIASGADPGDYEGLLAAQIVTKGKGAQVGAAAAARLTFTVESKTLLGLWWFDVRTFFSDNEPWTWIVPALVLFALLLWQLRSRFAFRVERRA